MTPRTAAPDVEDDAPARKDVSGPIVLPTEGSIASAVLAAHNAQTHAASVVYLLQTNPRDHGTVLSVIADLEAATAALRAHHGVYLEILTCKGSA